MNKLRKICCAAACLSFALAFAAAGCNPSDVTDNNTVTVTADVITEIDVGSLSGTCFQYSGTKISRQKNSKFSAVELMVDAGEKYYVSFATGDTEIYGVLFADSSGKLMNGMFAHKKDGSKQYTKQYDNVQIVIPEGCEWLYINSANPKEIEVFRGSKQEQTVNKQDVLPDALKIACLNCGQFEHDGSAAGHQAQWQAMVEGFGCDLFMFEDSLDNYADGVLANDIITREGQSVYTACTQERGNVRLASSYKPRTVAIVPFDFSITGSTKTTERCFAVRYTFIIANKEVAFYGLHLVAEGHISDVQQDDGSSLSQKLRQVQFSQLIEDGKNYDACVFMGDFNAQRADEYAIFTNNGFTITNCNEAFGGTVATLRDIPADNIVASNAITVEKFEVNTVCDVGNTDHKPLYAEIKIA